MSDKASNNPPQNGNWLWYAGMLMPFLYAGGMFPVYVAIGRLSGRTFSWAQLEVLYNFYWPLHEILKWSGYSDHFCYTVYWAIDLLP